MIVLVRPATLSDVYALARSLREGDRAEQIAVGRDPRRALRLSFLRSLYAPEACVVDGEVAAMWGLGGDFLSEEGQPWLMTGTAVERIPVAFVKIATGWIEQALAVKPSLVNSVIASYPQALALLTRLGFRLDEPQPAGHARFCRFHVTREQWQAFQRQPKVLRPAAKVAPFIVYTAGRSRTAWLSEFLTYGRCRCLAEVGIRLRSMEDVRALYAIPGMGTAETAAAPMWQMIRHYVPGIRSVVVRRPLEDIIASFARITAIDEAKLRNIIAYENRCLDKISMQSDTLTVEFEDLHRREACAAIFEHCTPYKFDEEWWLAMKDRNIQSSVADIFSYYRDHRDGVEGFKRAAKRDMIALVRAGKLTCRA